ncbi:MAG TPA: thioredoxin domain-containing protein [Bdellovibrionota bacterium]|nr:thioredoxin domain-containing protein [Bdellovibrionota bacterium]
MNRLAKETSPYLQQHKDNPVDWYPWSDEAFRRATDERKPVLLSIGYSACHWCHVMQHESFEDAEIAAIMNEKFINIKVDREERPDLDQLYQPVAQAMTRSGGWPLTVFLTPDRKPFFGGTYFPPQDRYGRPGFARILNALAEAYRDDPAGVEQSESRLTGMIRSLQDLDLNQSVSTEPLSQSTTVSLNEAAEAVLGYVDFKKGGVDGAPKFPNTPIFSFLWRFGLAADSERSREATRVLLRNVADSGLYDQLGGGFHRYSVDEGWNVPHFEKMLYDSALLIRLYSEVLLTPNIGSGDRLRFREVLEETVRYLLREMRDPGGGFYSAQDADAAGESNFYVWRKDELSELVKAGALTELQFRVLCSHYGITDQGNFEGGNVLRVSRSPDQVARELRPDFNIDEAQTREVISSARARLLEVREKRARPGMDKKILAAWNGLVISGLVWASKALAFEKRDDAAAEALLAAKHAFRFISERLVRDGDRLYSSYQGRDVSKLNAYLDDYAFMAMAALDLSRGDVPESDATGYLNWSGRWLSVIIRHFRGESGETPGTFYFTSDDHEPLFERPKMLFDHATPSGTAVALTAMRALSEFDPVRFPFEDEVRSRLSVLFPFAAINPLSASEILSCSLLEVLGPVLVSGRKAAELCRHPHVFRKPVQLSEADPSKYVVCHRQVCGVPVKETAAAAREIEMKLKTVARATAA